MNYHTLTGKGALLLVTAVMLLGTALAHGEELGSIEGDFLFHGRPLAGVKVMLTRQLGSPNHTPFEPVETDEKGHFKFENVPAGEYAVGHLQMYRLGNEHWHTNSGTDSHRRNVIVGPGEHVALPPYPAGHTVRGRMVLAPGATLEIAWQGGDQRIIRTVGKTTPKDGTPEAYDAWRKSDEFKKLWPLETKIVVDVHADGSFVARDVPPGQYVLGIDVGRQSAQEEAGPAGRVSAEFIVKDDDVDLGELTVREIESPSAK